MARTDMPTSAAQTSAQVVGTQRKPCSKASPAVGSLCRNMPSYVQKPPIEAVVFGWGVAEDGQLGLDTEEDVVLPKVVEALLGTRFMGRNFTKNPLVAGSRNTLAVDADGQILSWGWNARGTLGHGHGRRMERKPKRIAALADVKVSQVTIGGWHCLALAEDGRAYAWGGNEYGQCQLAADQRDVLVPTPCVPHLHVTQVAAGGMHSCVLTDAGEVHTWGEPWGDFSMLVDRKPRLVAGACNIAKIACGAFHNLALTKEGEVLAWGINDFGQLGNGSTDYEVTPAKVLGLEDVEVADIAAGGWHSLALTASGEVYIWGRGEYGRLGLGDTSGSSKLRATRVEGLEGHCVVQATCGGTHTTVLTAEGRIFTWGRASLGRLGIPVERDCYSPVEVYLPGGPERWRVISICAGGRHTMALALPDNDASSPARAPVLPPRPPSRPPSRPVSATLSHLPPGDPIVSEVDVDVPLENGAGVDVEDEEFEEEDEQLGGRSPPGGRSPQDLVSALDREEAEADAEEASGRVPGGIVPGSAADYAQEEAGLSEANSPGGDSPGLQTGRPTMSQQQLQSMLSAHGLRDIQSDE